VSERSTSTRYVPEAETAVREWSTARPRRPGDPATFGTSALPVLDAPRLSMPRCDQAARAEQALSEIQSLWSTGKHLGGGPLPPGLLR
jgi:hypothetical protein